MARRAAPAQRLLARKVKRNLPECFLGEWAPQGGQPVRVATAMIGLDGPRHLDSLAGNPRGLWVHMREHCRPSITKFGVGRVHVYPPKASIGRPVASGHTTRIKNRGGTRRPPRAEVVPVVGGAAFSCRVDGAERWIADRGLGSVVGTHWEFAMPRRRWAVWYGAAGCAVARVTSNCASVAEPEARLSVLPTGFPIFAWDRAPARVRFDRRWMVRDRSVPRCEVTVHPISRHWRDHRAVPGNRCDHACCNGAPHLVARGC
mmetsp:Transcript_16870/g.49675  ORF Transcript_16870/g.49675 Transcript_16870/m.49675 type:complete len:260 (+) Transcript_16870:373-1152(+)